MKEVTMEYEVSLLNAGDVIQALQNGMSMVLNHDNKNIQHITGYVKCLRNMGLLNEKISSVEPDVILVDIEHPYKIDKNKFASKGRNTPFDGWEVKGRVLYTLCDGKIIYQEEDHD